MSAPDPAGLRWLPRAYLLAGAGSVFLLFALLERDPVLVLVAVPLLVVPIASALAAPRPAPSAALAWSVSGNGAEVRILGVVRGTPPGSTDDMMPTFARPSSLTETAPTRVEWWPGAIRFDLRWATARPVLERVPPPSLTWKDPLGLAEQKVGGSPRELLVQRYPLDLIRLGALRLDRTNLLPGRSPTRRVGATGDYFGIRLALPNESPRQINWKASARAGRWLANEYEVERTGELALLIDTRPSGLGVVGDARFLGVARAAAVGISRAFLQQKMRVGYAAFGEFLQAIPISTGRNQELRIQRAVLATWGSATEGPSERCAVSLRRYYPPGLNILLLSSLASDAAVELVYYLRRRGYPVLVLNPAWRALTPRDRPLPARTASLAARLNQLDRRMRLSAIRSFAAVVDWEDLASLGDLAYVLRQPVRRRV